MPIDLSKLNSSTVVSKKFTVGELLHILLTVPANLPTNIHSTHICVDRVVVSNYNVLPEVSEVSTDPARMEDPPIPNRDLTNERDDRNDARVRKRCSQVKTFPSIFTLQKDIELILPMMNLTEQQIEIKYCKIHCGWHLLCTLRVD